MREIRVQLLQKVFSFWETKSPRPPDFAPTPNLLPPPLSMITTIRLLVLTFSMRKPSLILYSTMAASLIS